MMKRLSMFTHLFISVSSTFLALGLAEVSVRIFNPQPIRPAMHKIDPLYGRTTIPELRGYLKEPEFTHTFQLNSLGFRDKERTPHKPENTFRIIGLGDSFSWGVGVKRHETFLQQLENMLDQSSDGMSYEVFNWGVNGWGTAQELLCLKRQVHTYSPDLILIQYYKGNDLTDNIYKSSFRFLDEKGMLAHSNYDEQKVSCLMRATHHIPFYRFLAQHSQLLGFLRAQLLTAAEESDRRHINATIPDDSFAYGLQLTEALLDELFSYAKNNGVAIAMLIIPHKDELSALSAVRNPIQQHRASQEGRMLADVCRRHNIPHLDLSQTFSKEGVFLLYYSIDEHLTPYGHAVTAEAAFHFLKKHRLINGTAQRRIGYDHRLSSVGQGSVKISTTQHKARMPTHPIMNTHYSQRSFLGFPQHSPRVWPCQATA